MPKSEKNAIIEFYRDQDHRVSWLYSRDVQVLASVPIEVFTQNIALTKPIQFDILSLWRDVGRERGRQKSVTITEIEKKVQDNFEIYYIQHHEIYDGEKIPFTTPFAITKEGKKLLADCNTLFQNLFSFENNLTLPVELLHYLYGYASWSIQTDADHKVLLERIGDYNDVYDLLAIYSHINELADKNNISPKKVRTRIEKGEKFKPAIAVMAPIPLFAVDKFLFTKESTGFSDPDYWTGKETDLNLSAEQQVISMLRETGFDFGEHFSSCETENRNEGIFTTVCTFHHRCRQPWVDFE